MKFRFIFNKVNILENWKDHTSQIEVNLPKKIIDKEKILLKEVKSFLIKLPFNSLNVLIIGKIGKNILGTYMDTKIVGWIIVKGQKELKTPKIDCMVVLNITSEPQGNVIGIVGRYYYWKCI